MINVDYITIENTKMNNLHWSAIPDSSCGI